MVVRGAGDGGHRRRAGNWRGRGAPAGRARRRRAGAGRPGRRAAGGGGGHIAAGGCPALPIVADLAEVPNAAGVDRAAEHFGALHGLVNAAGITDRGTIDDTTPELFERIFAVDARAPFFLIQRVLPWLRRAGGGTIVNVCSINVHGGTPQLTAYVGAKAALAAMTKNIAAAVARDRVRVNGLNLGWTLTPNEHGCRPECTGGRRTGPRRSGRAQPFGRLLAR